MKIYTLNYYGTNYNIGLIKGNYVNNNKLAVLMYITTKKGKVKEDFGDLTVNIDDSNIMANENDTQFIDTNNLGKEIFHWLINNNIAKPTGLIGFSGYCAYPLFQFTQEALDGMDTLE